MVLHLAAEDGGDIGPALVELLQRPADGAAFPRYQYSSTARRIPL
ncbi:hypothetical protein [Microlunatus ginsengisoli]